MNAKQLLEELEQQVGAMMAEAQKLREQFNDRLWLNQPAKNSWSAGQVVEHLNSYNRYYLPQIEKSIVRGREREWKFRDEFNPGWLGNYFTNRMKPTEDGQVIHKMQAPKEHRPGPALNLKIVLFEFIREQKVLMSLLKRANEVNIGRVRVPISLNPLIKLKLGDTFNFLVAHQRRHFIQLKRALHVLPASQPVNVQQAVG